MKGEPALLKTKRIFLQVDEVRELSKKTARRGLDGHGISLVVKGRVTLLVMASNHLRPVKGYARRFSQDPF